MSIASAHAPGAPGDRRVPAGTTRPTRRRSRSRLASVLLAAVMSVVGTAFVMPATPAHATLDYPIQGQWNGWPWYYVTFNGTVGATADTCNNAPTKTTRFRNVLKFAPNFYRGEMAHIAYGSDCPRVDDWQPATFTIDQQGTRLAVASKGATMWFNRSAVPHIPKCMSGKVIEEKFNDNSQGFGVHAYTVQFSNLNYCYDGINVWFKDEPQAAVWISDKWHAVEKSQYKWMIQGACTGKDKTPLDPTNIAKRSSIYVSCLAVFSNKKAWPFVFSAQRDINGRSGWTLGPFVNFAASLGTGGALVNNPTSDTPRRWTLVITPANTYSVSGIGNDGRTPMP